MKSESENENRVFRKKRVAGHPANRQNGRVNDYERIARVIRHLDEHQLEQPELAALAKIAGLSPFHFHRLFSAWAGVTPKDFLQCLTLARVKEMLRNGESVLNAALNAGLSGPGRLHDLCVNLEAASPGEWKLGGDGWTIVAGFADSPFGKCLIGESPRGICHLSFVECGEEEAAFVALQEDWPRARLKRGDSVASRIAAAVFEHPQNGESRPGLRAFVRGTAFQVKVWRALLRVQAGMLVTYGGLASLVDRPAASRAVGSAVGKNPLACLIPCHRVIRETGVLGGYRWGPLRKRAMISRENARTMQVSAGIP